MTTAPPTPSVSLRLSVTDFCQLRCLYCRPAEGAHNVPHKGDVLTLEEMVRFVRVLQRYFGLERIRLTGGEPLLRSDLRQLVEMLAAEGVADLALTTNGQLLAPMAATLRQAGLGRVNVSLDSLSPATYRRITRGGELARTIEGINAALEAGLRPVKLNAVVMRGVNDHEVEGLARFGLERGCHVRFLELMPIGSAKRVFDDLFVPTADVRARLAGGLVLTPLPYHSPQTSHDFHLTDAAGRRGIVGFISSESRPFCRGCNRLRLTSTGQLIACLARGRGPNIRELLKDTAFAGRLRKVIAGQLAGKRDRVSFETERPMAKVGG
jgi:cyclic pyranopterin phosphate synthase